MRPIIGITMSRRINSDAQPTAVLNDAYVSAVLQAGGSPTLLPSLLDEAAWQSLFPDLDGILFSGGGDIAVERFGGAPHPRLSEVEPDRDALELALLRAAVDSGKPFFGICRGCQLVNVGFGGTLYTHIPDQLPGALEHDLPGKARAVLAHTVRIEEGSCLADILGQPLVEVNSHHHQGIKDLGRGLTISGFSPDGLIEAIEASDHPFGVAVQWHPEWLTDQEPTRNLFRRFVEAASRAA